MRRLIRIVPLLALTVLPAGEPGPAPRAATSLTVAEPAFRDPEVRVAMSVPPQFDLMLVRELPSAGWSLVVDEVTIDAAEERIVARITEVAPAAAAAQVITPAKCRVPLGKLSRGRYVLELWLRRGTAQPHTRAQALVLHAR